MSNEPEFLYVIYDLNIAIRSCPFPVDHTSVTTILDTVCVLVIYRFCNKLLLIEGFQTMNIFSA